MHTFSHLFFFHLQYAFDHAKAKKDGVIVPKPGNLNPLPHIAQAFLLINDTIVL